MPNPAPPMNISMLPASWWSGAWPWLQGLGSVGLILLAFADSAPFVDAPPGTLDVFLIVLSGSHPQSWAWYALMASAGEIMGGYFTYRVAQAGSRKALEKRIGEATAGKLYKQFEKRAFITLFTGAVLPPPFPFTPLLMAAGITQCPRKTFISALAAGRGLRYFATAWLARLYGRQMIALFARNYRPALYILISLAVAGGIGALIYFRYRRVRSRRGLDGQSVQPRQGLTGQRGFRP